MAGHLLRCVLLVAAFLLVVARSSCCRGAAAAAAETTTVDGITAIYNFGASLTDTGNLIREGATGLLRNIGKIPYGIDLLQGPTGRCSNGYLMIDFLAKYIGLPLLNPYLDKAADFTHGVNFAVAGATALDTATLAERGVTISIITNSSLDVQLQWFKDFMASATNSSQEIRRKLASSLVMLEIGGNDFNYAFLQQQQTGATDGGGYGLGNVTRIVETLEQAGSLVPPVVHSISNAANLLEMGAVRVVIAGNFPIGCVPVYLAGANVTEPAAYDADGCLGVLNAFAELYNAALRGAVASLQRAHPRAVVAYADYFAAYAAVLREARARGFDPARTRTACCGDGGAAYGFDEARFCGAPGAAVCADRDRYVSWDGVHPTEHAYEEMAELLYRGGLAYPPPIKWPAVPGQTMPGSMNVTRP